MKSRRGLDRSSRREEEAKKGIYIDDSLREREEDEQVRSDYDQRAKLG